MIRDASCTAIQATSHELKYTAGLACRREFREQFLEMLLVLLFGKREGDAHAEAGFYALHRTEQPQRPLHAKSRAESRAHPKHIFRFDEHSPGADVPRAGFQPDGTPFDLKMSLVAKTRRPAAVQPARRCSLSVHGPGAPRENLRRAKIEPVQRASALKIRR